MMEDGHGFCRVSHFRYFLVPVVLLIVLAMVKLACPPCPLIILIRLQLREPETASSRLAILYTGVGALGSGRAKRKQLLRHVVEEGHKPTEKTQCTLAVSTSAEFKGRLVGHSVRGYVSDVQSGDVTVPDGTCRQQA